MTSAACQESKQAELRRANKGQLQLYGAKQTHKKPTNTLMIITSISERRQMTHFHVKTCQTQMKEKKRGILTTLSRWNMTNRGPFSIKEAESGFHKEILMLRTARLVEYELSVEKCCTRRRRCTEPKLLRC